MIGIGVDVVEIGRMRRALERRAGMAERIFSAAELEYANRSQDPAQHLAARFAAKEAVFKSLGVGIGGARFADVEVLRSESGAPGLALAGKAAALASEHGVKRWHLSLSHTDTVAVASVVAEG